MKHLLELFHCFLFGHAWSKMKFSKTNQCLVCGKYQFEVTKLEDLE